MKKIYYSCMFMPIYILLFSLPLAHAMNVSVIIQFPSKTEIYIVNVSSNATAKQALIVTGLNTTWSYGGAFLDCISGVCGKGSSRWWCFTYKNHGKWVFSSVGLSSYKCKEGDVLGLRFLQGVDSANCFKCFSACNYEIVEKYCAPSNTSRKNNASRTTSRCLWYLIAIAILLLSKKVINVIKK